MRRQIVHDVTGAPPSRLSLRRSFSAIFSFMMHCFFAFAVCLPVLVPLVYATIDAGDHGDTATEGNYFAAVVGLMVLAPSIGALIWYRREHASQAKALRRIRLYGRTLAEVRAALSPYRKDSRRMRGLLLLLNLALAIGIPTAAHSFFGVFDKVDCVDDACRTAYRESIPSSFWAMSLAALFALNGFRLWADLTSFLRTFLLVLVILAGWSGWLVLFGSFASQKASNWAQLSEPLNAVLFFGGGIVLMLITPELWAKTRATLKDIRRRDKRPPVLFLRSFDDEEPGGGSTVERDLYEALRAYGPFVAIGRPGEIKPAGAAREYFPDEGWQPAVLKLMEECGVIVVMPGLTQGLDWEVRQIARRGHVRKTIFILPSTEKLVERIKRLVDLLGDTPEGWALSRLKGGYICALHYIDQVGWAVIEAKDDTTGVSEAAVDTALFGMWLADRETLAKA